MKLIIHDLDEKYNKKITDFFAKDGTDIHIISNDGTIKHCIGCFGCWVKTPGKCVLKDEYNTMGALGGKTKELIIISKCVYGTYSPFVKNVWDRFLPYVHPDFTKRNNEIHHKLRYENSMNTRVYFYGDVNDREKETAIKIVNANLVNFNGFMEDIKFIESVEELFSESSVS